MSVNFAFELFELIVVDLYDKCLLSAAILRTVAGAFVVWDCDMDSPPKRKTAVTGMKVDQICVVILRMDRFNSYRRSYGDKRLSDDDREKIDQWITDEFEDIKKNEFGWT